MIDNYAEPEIDVSIIDDCREKAEKDVHPMTVTVYKDDDDPDIDSLGIEFSY